MGCATILALAACLAVPIRAWGQESVTEADFLRPFETDTHPAVLALGDELARAEAARLRAGTFSNPRLEYGREQPEGNPRQTTWTLAWSPPLDRRLDLAKAAADAGVQAARQRLIQDRLHLRAELRKAFADWALSQDRREILEQQHEAVSALATQAERRAAVGEESGVAAQRLRLAEAEVAAALGAARAEAVRADSLVRSWRPDLAPDARPTRATLPPLPAGTPSAVRSDLAAFRFEARQAGLEARLSRRFLIFPELQAGWQRLQDEALTQSGAVFGVSWSVPLFDRSQAERLEASGRRAAAEARVTLTERRVQAELEASLAAYQALRHSAQDAAEVASGTGRLVRGATASFRAGESSVTDLLDVLRAVREARVREIDLYGAALEAHRRLEAAVGRPLPQGSSP